VDGTDYIGVGTRAFFMDIERRFPGNPLHDLDLEERVRRKDAYYLATMAPRARTFPATAALASELRRRGLPLAVASASSPEIVETVLAATGLRGLFGLALSAYDVERHKPEPDVFLEAARRLGARPRECVVFEDSRIGVIAARRAGMRCVALPAPSGDSAPLHPDFRAADLVIEGGPAALDTEALLATLELWGAPA